MIQWTPKDEDVLSRMIAAETLKGSSPEEMAAIAYVAINRANKTGQSIHSVVMAPSQFSSVHKNLAGKNNRFWALGDNNPDLQQAREIVQGVKAGKVPNPVGNSTHYYSPSGMKGHKEPSWFQSVMHQLGGTATRVGNHIFAGGPGGKVATSAKFAHTPQSAPVKPTALTAEGNPKGGDSLVKPVSQAELLSLEPQAQPVLRRGDFGPDVSALQSRLNAAGGQQLRVDGVFGPRTEAAVRNFEKASGSQVDKGIAGPEVWSALNDYAGTKERNLNTNYDPGAVASADLPAAKPVSNFPARPEVVAPNELNAQQGEAQLVRTLREHNAPPKQASMLPDFTEATPNPTQTNLDNADPWSAGHHVAANAPENPFHQPQPFGIDLSPASPTGLRLGAAGAAGGAGDLLSPTPAPLGAPPAPALHEAQALTGALGRPSAIGSDYAQGAHTQAAIRSGQNDQTRDPHPVFPGMPSPFASDPEIKQSYSEHPSAVDQGVINATYSHGGFSYLTQRAQDGSLSAFRAPTGSDGRSPQTWNAVAQSWSAGSNSSQAPGGLSMPGSRSGSGDVSRAPTTAPRTGNTPAAESRSTSPSTSPSSSRSGSTSSSERR